MAMAGTIGAGTLAIIILLIILAIMFLLYFLEVPFMKYIFWSYFVALIVILAIITNVPYDTGEIREESNPHFWKICLFGLFIFIGFAGSIVFYIKVVLLQQDIAKRLPRD